MLSEHEQQRLSEVEEWFERSDPQFSKSLDEGVPTRTVPPALPAFAFLGAPAVLLIVIGLLSFNGGLIIVGVVAGMGGILAHTLAQQDAHEDVAVEDEGGQ